VIPGAYSGVLRSIAAHTPVYGWLRRTTFINKLADGLDVRSASADLKQLREQAPTFAKLMAELKWCDSSTSRLSSIVLSLLCSQSISAAAHAAVAQGIVDDCRRLANETRRARGRGHRFGSLLLSGGASPVALQQVLSGTTNEHTHSGLFNEPEAPTDRTACPLPATVAPSAIKISSRALL
jgi:hypothetical protein